MYSEVGQTPGLHDAYGNVSFSCYIALSVPNVQPAAGVSQRLQVESSCPCFGMLGHASPLPERDIGKSGGRHISYGQKNTVQILFAEYRY